MLKLYCGTSVGCGVALTGAVWMMVEITIVNINNKAMANLVMSSFAMPYGFCLDGCLYM